MEELKEAPKQLNQDGRKGDGDNNVRITPPGRKRLFLTISVVFSFLLGTLPCIPIPIILTRIKFATETKLIVDE